MAEVKRNSDQDHHVVPKSYLKQWQDKNNQLKLFTHEDGKYFERGADWAGFKKKNYNIYEDDDFFFIPEKITEDVDTQSIDVIRSLEFGKELTGYQRSVLAHAVALQYVRTPRFRSETDLMLEEQIKEPFLESQRKLTDKELLDMKKEALNETPKTKQDEKAIEEIKQMSDQEFIDSYREFLDSGNMKMGLNKFGHSKLIFKVNDKAKGLFNFMWFFFFSPKGTSFITSDNPCFAVPKEESDFGVGLFSPNGLVVFPLRPDVCLVISPEAKSGDERFKKASKSNVRELNKMILENSYETVVAKDTQHLQSLTKGYSHKKTRTIKTKEFGEYKMTSLH